LKQALADALADRGYETLTPVQEEVSKPELAGMDMLVSAQTGSGKTVGFGLAIAPTLLGEAEKFDRASAPLALVIAPTRELALQVKREFQWLFRNAGAVIASCVGGMDMREERRNLERGAHMVVATPGRLRDHITRGSINLGSLRAVVLDEADEMLDLGFREDLEFILGEAPTERQTLMFSATVPREIAGLAKSYQKNALRIATANEAKQHADIEYRALNVSQRDSENAIINVLRYYEAPNAIVFANTRAMVNRLTTRLSNRGFPVVALSGELSQAERTHALQAMRDGRARVCVATDVAARGIDLPNLDLVVHAELPNSHETMLHRSGRTGRAGRKGVSTLIVPPKMQRKAERLMHSAKVEAVWASAPSADEVMAKDAERMMGDDVWQQEIKESEQPAIEALLEKFGVAQIAAAYLRAYHARHSAPEELSVVQGATPEKRKPRGEFGPTIWFSIAGGTNAGAEPRRILPMLCKVGDLTKDDIGRIRVQADQSYVELREGAVAGFLSNVGTSMMVEGGASLTQLDKPPAVADTPRPAFKPRDDKPRGGGGFDRDRGGDRGAPRDRDRDRGKDRDSKPARKSEPRGEYTPRPEGVVTPIKPRRKSAEGGFDSRKPGGKPKGPPPPKSRPNSKKNKARAQAAGPKAGAPKGKGGTSAPRRDKP
jgi:ATP-dependent RNA helicase DeaD